MKSTTREKQIESLRAIGLNWVYLNNLLIRAEKAGYEFRSWAVSGEEEKWLAEVREEISVCEKNNQ